jgi:hypothetical protein
MKLVRIPLIQASNQFSGGQISIIVRTLTGKEIDIDINSNGTIEDLKELI